MEECFVFTHRGNDYGNDVVSCDVCQKAGPDIAGKTEFVTGKKKFKRESLIIIKVGNMKNVSIWYQQKPIP
jgi:hypothetical protein